MSLLLLFKRLRSGLKVPFLATKRRQPRPRDIDTEPTERSWGRWTNPGHVHPIGPGARGVKAAPSGGGQPPKQPSPAPKPAKAPANPQKGGAKPAPAPRPAKAPTETPKGQEPAPAPTPARSKLSQRKLPKPPKVKPPTMAAEPAPKPPPAPKPIPEAVPEAEAGYMGGEDEHGSSAEAPSSHQAVAASYLRPTEEPEEPLNQPVGNEPATRVGVHVPSGERHPSTKPVDVHLPKEEAERQVARAHRDKGPGAEETPGETEPYKEVIDEIVDAMRQRFQYNRHGIGSEESAWGNAVLHGEARGRQLLRDAGATPDEIEPILRRALDRAWDNRAQEETRGEKIQPRQVRAMIKDKAWPMLKDYLLENVEGISTLSAEETNRRVNQAVNLIQYGDRPQEAIDRLKRQLAGTEPALTEAEEEVVRQSYAQMDRIIEDAVRNRAQGWNTRDPDYFLHPQNMRTLVRMYLRQSGMTGEQATPDLVNRLAREAMSRIEPVSEENVFLAPAREDDEEESGATPLDQIDLSQYNLSPEDEEKVRSIIPGLTSFAQMIINSYNEHHGTNRYPGYDQPTSYDHLESEMYRLFQYVGQELRYRGVNRPRVGVGQDDLVNELIDIATDRIKLAPARGDEELKQVETPQTGQSKLQDFRDAADITEAMDQWHAKEPIEPSADATPEEAEAWAAERRRWEQQKPRAQDWTPEGKKFIEKLRGNQKAHELAQKVSTSQMSRSQRLQLEKQLDDLVAQWEPRTKLGWESLDPSTEGDDPVQKQIIELRKTLDDKSTLAHKVLRESLKDTGADWKSGKYYGPPVDRENKGAKVAEEGVSFVNGMVAAPGIKEQVLTVPNTAAVRGRAYYDRAIHIDPSKNGPSDWIHEFGHHLETYVPGLKELARQFLQHRVGDEKPVSLKKLFPLRGFKYGEMGREDDFGKVFGAEAHYVGKEYPDGQTEIISMGLEKMYSDPVGFAQMDPEYFAFMVGVMDGSLLKEAEPEEINPEHELLQGGSGREEKLGATPLDQIDLSEYNLSPEYEERVREVMDVGTKRVQKWIDRYQKDDFALWPSTYDFLEDHLEDIRNDVVKDLQNRLVNPDEDLVNEIVDVITDRIRLDLPEDPESNPKQAPAQEKPSDVKAEFNTIPGGTQGPEEGRKTSREQLDALEKYTRENWADLNDDLRQGRELTPKKKKQVELLDSLATDTLGKAKWIYRGSVHPLYKIKGDDGKFLREGYAGRVTLRGYTSTSFDPDEISNFTEAVAEKGETLIDWEIQAPVGTRGINVKDRLSTRGRDDYMDQQEFILPRGTSIDVTTVRKVGPNHYKITGKVTREGTTQAPARGDEVTADDLSDWIGNG